MKTFILILVIILMTFSNSYSQTFWEKTAWPDTAKTNSLAISSNGDIFAATTDGIFRSTDDGYHWQNLGINKEIRLVYVGPDGDVFITTAEQGSILCSTDNGTNWIPIGLTSWQNSIAISPNGDTFAGTDNFGVYRKSNNAGNWVQIIQGLTDLHITSLKINSNGDIFAGTIFEGIFRSTDNGENWVQINQGLTRYYITTLAINSNGHIFAGTSGQGVFRSIDNGDNWVQINNGLFGEHRWVSSIEININGDIFTGTGDGVLQSTDNGENWVEINQGLSNHHVRSIGIYSGVEIFAGTTGGIFKRSANATSINTTETKIASSFELYQNYPNPFNPSTKISWQAPVASWQTLKVYNVLGNEVATLMDEYKPAGNYEVDFNVIQNSGPAVTSGVYFYKLQSGNFVESKKMILLK